MLQSQLPVDAAYYYHQLESRFADKIARDGLSGKQLAERARQSGDCDFAPQFHGVPWPSNRIRLEHSVMQYTQPSHDVVRHSPLPFFSRLSLETYQNEQRLAFETVATGQVDWMVPLRNSVRGTDDGYLAVSQIGHQMFFVNRGVLHAVSPIEKKILWTKSFEDQIDNNLPFRQDSRPAIAAMMAPGRDDLSMSLLLQRTYSLGHLAIVQPDYLCIHGRRTLSVLDPAHG